MNINFRHRCAQSLARAKLELESADSERLKYAALELRMAIEAITYDRAQSYRDELPPSEYKTWQPKKLMQVILEIEPHADKPGSLAFGVEDVPGVQAKEMTFLGKEQVFDYKAIKRHYDALGSFLHTPTQKNLEEKGEHDLAKLKQKCVEIVLVLDAVMFSPIFNINFRRVASIQCMNPDCGKTVQKRIPQSADAVTVKCFGCETEYELSAEKNGTCRWKALLEEVPCPTELCGQVTRFKRQDLKSGSHWQCVECKHRFQLRLSAYEVMTDP